MKRSGFAVMARLIGLVRPLVGYMALAVTMGLAGHLCATFLTVLGGFGILGVLGFALPLPLAGLFGIAAILALLRAVLCYGEQACNHFIAFKLLALLRDKVFRALRRLAPAKLESREKGDLIAVITSDIELLEVFYAHTISPALIALLFSAVMVVFIAGFHPLLGALALAAYAVVGLAVPLATSRASGQDGLRLRTASGALAGFVLDSLRGLPEILQYGAGTHRLQQMQARTEALSREEARLKRTAGRSTAATQLILWLFDLGMLFAATALCLAGAVDFAGVLIPTIALMSSFGPVVALANLGATLQSTFAAGNRVLDILEETPLVQDIHGQPEVTFAGAGAENVTFGYGAETILQNVTVPVPAGQTIGIVGRSGSGKSTLLKLFLRFWQVEQGQVQISGRSVEHINTGDLRRMQALVTQETHLFHDSIRNNLRIAKQDATDEELVAACKKASLHDFIAALPQGYDTPVGELGDTLSGGERQRLGLARAFLHDAPFLLLDEPTSNLDSLNEAVILQALEQEHGRRTVVLVSHRASTMGIADTVYSVENGRVS
ncbi:thiol reductant ABC exporter subunit CydC [uncultured Subdoligranulum sp.]|uniref:thiol reductant ABC exporter subunit CydC n=1 Tax=uncultured Subdoligranulum sp. TaxID=512298 RepID=UPI0026164240|nr:thiol reductant ABC exporter subunit CydC [uncultured Subdoligranulum sp.]